MRNNTLDFQLDDGIPTAYFCHFYCCRAADTVASNDLTTAKEVKSVNLKFVYFQDYLTGNLTDITEAWGNGDCATTAYTGRPDLATAGTNINPNCSFSSYSTYHALLSSSAALCQGFVTAVHYTVSHDTTTAAGITSISATATISDVPITNSDANNGTAVTVAQTFGVAFSSADPSGQSSDNGNLVKR